MRNQNVRQMLKATLAFRGMPHLLSIVNFPSVLADCEPGRVTRAELAHALNLTLFHDLIGRSANARRYTDEVIATGGAVHFDHGALRTVRWRHNGALPPGEAAFTRILLPLGFRMNGRYPLTRLGMTGRAYAHCDAPDEIAQFFVSELHPERFSTQFQAAVTNVVDTSVDPLTPLAQAQLMELQRDGCLPLDDACMLLTVLRGCFSRQHARPARRDYQVLLRESAEMAWIATEGNAFNHATDRVEDVFKLAESEKEKGRPMKADVECSESGRVFQTAYHADIVAREFVADDGGIETAEVPGSFYEFITRRRLRDLGTTRWQIDLAFDASNAQGIFKMTAGARDAV